MSTAHRRAQDVIDAIEVHHGRIRDELSRRVVALTCVVAAREPHEPARIQLLTFLRDELMLHLETERKLLHVVGSSFESTVNLVESMTIGYRQILDEVRILDESDGAVDLAVSAGTILALIELRLETENTVLLPALAANGADLETLLAGRPEVLGDTPEEA